jgi:hypothetical protein
MKYEFREGGNRCIVAFALPGTWHLDPSWQAWFDDLQIIHEAGGTTLLIGQLPDQAALYGVLLTIRRLGLRLLAVETDEDDGSSSIISATE